MRPAAMRRPGASPWIAPRRGAANGPESRGASRDAKAVQSPAAAGPPNAALLRTPPAPPSVPLQPPPALRTALQKPLRSALPAAPTSGALQRLGERPLTAAPEAQPKPRRQETTGLDTSPTPPPRPKAPSAEAPPPESAPSQPAPRRETHPGRARVSRQPVPAGDQRPMETAEERPQRAARQMPSEARPTADGLPQGPSPTLPMARDVVVLREKEQETPPTTTRPKAEPSDPAAEPLKAAQVKSVETPSERPGPAPPSQATPTEPGPLRPRSAEPTRGTDAAPTVRPREAEPTAAPRTPSPPPPVTVRVGQIEIRAPKKKAGPRPSTPPRTARSHRIDPGISFPSGRW